MTEKSPAHFNNALRNFSEVINMKDEKQKETQGNKTDPQPEHGHDDRGHKDNGNHGGFDRKPRTSHSAIWNQVK